MARHCFRALLAGRPAVAATIPESLGLDADRVTAALPPEGKRTVLRFFVGMVEPGDRPLLDRLKLTEDI